MKIRIETNFSGELYVKSLNKLIKQSLIIDGGFNQFENNFINTKSSLYKNKYDLIVCQLTIDFFYDLECFQKPYLYNENNLKNEIIEKLNFFFKKVKFFEKKKYISCNFQFSE